MLNFICLQFGFLRWLSVLLFQCELWYWLNFVASHVLFQRFPPYVSCQALHITLLFSFLFWWPLQSPLDLTNLFGPCLSPSAMGSRWRRKSDDRSQWVQLLHWRQTCQKSCILGWVKKTLCLTRHHSVKMQSFQNCVLQTFQKIIASILCKSTMKTHTVGMMTSIFVSKQHLFEPYKSTSVAAGPLF